MAINLSDLTGASTSANILAEVQSTADFLDSVPLLKNLADPSGATDAKQSVALNQPKALPLIKNPSGDLGGYLYIPDVSGNYATGPSVTIGANETWEAEVDMVIDQFGNYIQPMGGGVYFTGFGLLLYEDVSIRLFSKYWADKQSITGITLNKPFNLTYGYDGTDLYANIDGNRVYTTVAPSQSSSITHTLEIAHRALTHQGNYAIQKAKLTVNNAVVFDCDFNGSTSIRHGDTKFQASVGGVVTINQSGNDPASIIKKPVLRFDGVDDLMDGVFNQTITGGYMFAAFSVLGDGGEYSARVLSVNSSGQGDTVNGGVIFSAKLGPANTLSQYVNGGWRANHVDLFEDDNGDILHESLIEDGNQISRVNNADAASNSITVTVSAEEFNIGGSINGDNNPAIDLEYLALFAATITDAQADAVRNYINNRNNVFDLKDGFGYYFYDPQSLADGAVSSWNGRIVGSDNGDVDKLATQSTSADQPTSDGYKVTFADNTDHLDIPSTTQAGWQVVGTSLGTFSYKVDADAITELNLLGNLGNASFRQAGDLYGIVLLPETATNREINEARKLLIDRGAADGVTGTSVFTNWHTRRDIVEFGFAGFSNVTNFSSAWHDCSSLTSFPLIDTSSSTNFNSAWRACSSLTSFPLIDTSSATNFGYAWRNCSSLTTFPAIDTSNGTNFTYAWRDCSSLTSFPLIGTSSATIFNGTWRGCSSLESFPAIDTSSGTSFSGTWQSCSSLTSFPLIDTSSGTNFGYAWYDCNSLTSFPLIDTSSGTTFVHTWRNCNSLTSFPLIDTSSGTNFNSTWRNCSSLTSFPLIDTSSGTNFGDTWAYCNSLTTFPAIDTSSGTNFLAAWRNCSSLESFPLIDTSSGTNFSSAWFNCSSLTSFPLIDTSSATNFYGAWFNCNSLTSFPLIDTSNGTNFVSAWYGCSSLTSFPLIDTSSATQFSNAWFNCNSLTSFPLIDTSSGTNFQSAWNGCSSLTSFPLIDTSSGTNFGYAWFNCFSLTSFPLIDTSSATNFVSAWYGCSSLTTFPAIDTSSATNFIGTWRGCNSLESFPAGFFDSWNPSSIASAVFSNTWDGCTSLTAQSVENILVSIAASGKHATSTGLSGGTALSDGTIDIDYDTGTGSLTTATLSAIESLNGRGWSVNINNQIIVPNILQLEPAAAYSLRSFDADADPNVVNVRRSSDGATSDFTASEVSDGTLVAWVGAGNDGQVTTWYDQRQIVETGDAYGTTISGTVDGSTATYNQIAPAVAGEFYRVRFTASNVNPRGRIRFRNYDSNADVTATAGLASMTYFNADGDYESYVPSDDGLGLWFLADAGQSFDYSGVSVQQVAEVPNNASQSTASAQPKIVDAGTLVTEGGLAAVDFDGTDDSLLIPDGLISNLDTLLVSAVVTNSDGNNDYGVVLGEPDGRIYVPYVVSNTLNIGYHDSAVKLQDGAYSNGLQLITLSVDSSTASGFKNGQAFSNVATATASSNPPAVFSSSNRIGGFGTQVAGSLDFSEVIIFDTDQSANRTGIENNINDHFDIYS